LNNIKKDKWEGSTRLRSDGRWETQICIDNVRKSFYGKTETESKRKMREYRNKVATGYVQPNKILFSEYCYNWLLFKKFRKVRESTFDRYESTYLHHIKDTIGVKQLGKITSKDIQQLLDNKASPIDGSEPLSLSSIKKIVELVFPCFEYAMVHKDINENPCIDVVIPKEEYCIKDTKETVILDEDELNVFKDACLVKTSLGNYKYKFGLYYILLLNTGLRCGELIALKWSDINFQDKIITIDKAVQSNVKDRQLNAENKRKNVVTKPKTKRGTRNIPLNKQTLFYLNEIQEYNKKYNIQTEYVASSVTGTMVRARNLQRTLDIITNNANIKHISLHDLRRTFGSTLLRKGVDISVVSSLMGHSSVRVTYDAYIKIIEEQKTSAIELLDIT